jgi:hypothetical protein
MLKRGVSGKRGSGHLEMIFAFVFFVGFVFFLLITLRPYSEGYMPETIVKGIADSFKIETSTNLTTFFLKVDYKGPGPANFHINFPNQNLMEFNITLSEVIVLDALSRDRVNASFHKPSTMLRVKNTTKNYFVLFSPVFSQGQLHPPASQPADNYIIGNLMEREVIAYSLVNNMKSKYEIDASYRTLKDKLGVPEVYDFSIEFIEYPELNMKREPPLSVEVYSKTFVFEILKNDGTLINTRVIVKVW